MVFSDIQQRDALLLIVLDLPNELTWSEYSVIKTELRNSMPFFGYRLNVHYALVEFLNRVPEHAVGMLTVHDGGVYLGVAAPIVVLNPPGHLDPFQAD